MHSLTQLCSSSKVEASSTLRAVISKEFAFIARNLTCFSAYYDCSRVFLFPTVLKRRSTMVFGPGTSVLDLEFVGLHSQHPSFDAGAGFFYLGT